MISRSLQSKYRCLFNITIESSPVLIITDGDYVGQCLVKAFASWDVYVALRDLATEASKTLEWKGLARLRSV